MGRHESLRQHQQALSLDPLSSLVGQAAAASLTFSRRYGDAIEQSKKVLAIHPNFLFGYIRLGVAYALMGMYPEAMEALQKADDLTDDPIRPKVQIAWLLALMGERERATLLLDELPSAHARAPFSASAAYVALGKYDRAFELLEAAFANRDPNLSLLKVSPMHDPLRSDPRFQDLLRRMNFPE